MRVGSPVPRRVDVRIIAATNRNIDVEIKKGNFSVDLINRLREVVIDVPPLRETPEMIPDIVNHFLEVYGAKYNKDLICSDETMSIFLVYQWPGNIQEVKNTIQNLIITCDGNEILPQHLPPSMHTGKYV